MAATALSAEQRPLLQAALARAAQRACAVLALRGRRRGARRAGPHPRRLQRRERRLPAGRCAEASALAAMVLAGGRRVAGVAGRRRGADAGHAVRRLPAEAARVRRRRRAGAGRRRRARCARASRSSSCCPHSFGPDHLNGHERRPLPRRPSRRCAHRRRAPRDRRACSARAGRALAEHVDDAGAHRLRRAARLSRARRSPATPASCWLGRIGGARGRGAERPQARLRGRRRRRHDRRRCARCARSACRCWCRPTPPAACDAGDAARAA